MQNFKGDAIELKFRAVAEAVGGALSTEKHDMFEDCFECFILGDLLYDTGRAPLANAIPREIFRQIFATVFDQFVLAGSAESYLFVFRKIFGDDVEVTFTVPAPGKLQIDIQAVGIELNNFGVRHIEDNTYVLDDLITQSGTDNIVFQTVKGFQSEYELEQMLFEMVPAGIYTIINLTLGG